MNLTHLAPSLDDLILLPHRAAERAKQFAYYYGLDDIFGRIRGNGAYFIAENTANRSNLLSASLTGKNLARETASAVKAAASSSGARKIPAVLASPGASLGGAAAVTGAEGTFGGAFSQGLSESGFGRFVGMTWEAWKSLGGILPYVLSKWAVATLLMSILINRTQFYASSRVPLTLWWPVRAGLFLLPITAVVIQAGWILQAMRCQTSPAFAEMRYGNASKVFEMDFGGEGGVLHALGSGLLFWESDLDACKGVQMSIVDGGKPGGSLSLLWPLFLSLCMGAFTDTLARALQGRAILSDFNLFELSFAFNEAESMVLKVFEAALDGSNDENGNAKFDRKMLLQATNTSPDMLLIAFIWACGSISSMVLAIFGKRHQYRLLNTGFWGIAYFFAISRSIWLMWSAFPSNDGFWSGRIPMILLMGFMPHLIVVVGMIACAFVYAAALLMTALSLPHTSGATTFRQRLALAYRNLQANVHFSNSTSLSPKMTDDFYTALLNAGYSILMAASEAVYLNEGARLRVGNMTWVEEKRLQELQQSLLYKKTQASIPPELRGAIADSPGDATVAGQVQIPGYMNERKIRGQDREAALAAVKGRSGTLAGSRNSRIRMARLLITGVFWLVVGFNVKMMLLALEFVGIKWRPAFFTRLIAAPKKSSTITGQALGEGHADPLAITLSDGRVVRVGADRFADVEVELRGLGTVDLDGDIYAHWRRGGHFGESDGSGEYVPPGELDDDVTSVISVSTDAASSADGDDNGEWEDDEEERESGRRTPTQRNPYTYSSRSSREVTPFEEDRGLDSEQLAALLDPRNEEQKHEARLLSRRLRHGGTMTRAQYNRATLDERAAILTFSRYGSRLALSSTTGGGSRPMTPAEEESALEEFIISRRRAASHNLHGSPHTGYPPNTEGDNDWATGAAGLGSSGPQCVVCQDSPRTILLWPCGCLCLCDECRVTMAARNFGSCVCCRTGTLAYSRLYVP